jgi:hypothetical protein
MNRPDWKMLGLKILAVLCMLIGCIGVLDMGINLMEEVLFVNLLALFLVVGVVLWRRARANQPPMRLPPNGKQWTALAVGGLVLLLTCAFPPLVKITRVGPLLQDRAVATEFYGYDCLLPGLGRREPDRGFRDDGSFVDFELAFGILEAEWLAAASITAAAFVLLRVRTNPGRGIGGVQDFSPGQPPERTGVAPDLLPGPDISPA